MKMSASSIVDYDKLAEQAKKKESAGTASPQGTPLVPGTPDYDKLADTARQAFSAPALPSSPAESTPLSSRKRSRREHRDTALERAALGFTTSFGIPESAARDPREILTGLRLAIQHPGLEADSLREMWNGMNEAQQDLVDRAYRQQHSPGVSNKFNGFLLGVYSSIPVLGPAYVHMADRWESGDKAGATGEMLGLATQVLAGGSKGKAGVGADLKPAMGAGESAWAGRAATAGAEETARLKSAAANAPKTGAETVSRPAIPGTVTAQRMAGTGPQMAREVAGRTVKEYEVFKTAEAEYNTKLTRLREDLDDHVAQLQEKHASDIAAREKSISEAKAKYADELAAARQDWVQKSYEYNRATEAQARTAARREALGYAQRAYSDLIRENVKQVHDATASALDKGWNEMTAKVGPETPVATVPVYDAIEQSRAMLSGVPEDLKVFDQITKQITEERGKIDTPSGPQPVPKESVPFEDARHHYTALGKAAFGAEGNVRRALFNVYNAYDEAISATARQQGAGKLYTDLKRSWSDYMRDWHDMSSETIGHEVGPKGGREIVAGSPLARLYRAPDTATAATKVLGKSGDRLRSIYGRYTQYGANPELMTKLRTYADEYKTLSKGRASKPTPPGKFTPPEPPAEPKPVPSIEPKVERLRQATTKRAQRLAAPSPEDFRNPPTIDDMVDRLRRAKQEAYPGIHEKSLTPNRYEVIMLALGTGGGAALGHPFAYPLMYTVAKFGEMGLVSSKLGRAWLTKVTPADIKVMNEVLAKTPDLKPQVQAAVTNGLIDKIRKGEPIPAPVTFEELLTRAQMGSVLKESVRARQNRERQQGAGTGPRWWETGPVRGAGNVITPQQP